MNSKLLGGVMLVVGTTIGAGMLALPVATAQLGFWGSLVLLFICWGIMTSSAFLFLEVNLWLPPNTNLISMAGATLGKWGQGLTWFTYLFLLYSVLSAYVAGGGDLFHYLLISKGIQVPASVAPIFFTTLFGLVVYLGMRAVDYVNRALMLGKMGSFVLLIIFILPFVSKGNLSSGELKYISSPSSISITALAFGCLMIIPSLRTYFDEDIQALRKAIFIGTLIPLFCYIAWDLVIMGVVPLEGNNGLKQILNSSGSTSGLVAAITTLLQKDVITMLAKFFTSICMATSFLSISLCLSDFLADGLKVEKRGVGNLVVYGATFLPPIFIVLFCPNAFLQGLNYAGISCFTLMIFLPALMAWRGRYNRDFAQNGHSVRGGKFLLALLLIFATCMIGFGIEHAI